MVPPSSNWYPLLDTVADSVDPLLAFFAVVVALREWKRSSWIPAAAFIVATALGLAGIYAVQAPLRHWGHYSTHAAFATSVAISLASWRPSKRVLLAAVWLAYLALIVIVGYHRVADVLIASAVASVVTIPWQIAARRVAVLR